MRTVLNRSGIAGLWALALALALALAAVGSAPAIAKSGGEAGCQDDSRYKGRLTATDVNIGNSLKLLDQAQARSAADPAGSRTEAIAQQAACIANGAGDGRQKRLVVAGFVCRARAAIIIDDAAVRQPAARSLTDIEELKRGVCTAQRAVALSRRLPSPDRALTRDALDAHATLTRRLSAVNGQSAEGRVLFEAALASMKEALSLTEGAGRAQRIFALGDAYADLGGADQLAIAETWYAQADAGTDRAGRYLRLAKASQDPTTRRRLLERARADDASSASINLALGKLDYAAQNVAAARLAFEVTVNASGQSGTGANDSARDRAEARYYLSLIAAAQNNWEAARTHIDEATTLGLSDPLRLVKQNCKITVARLADVRTVRPPGVSPCAQYARDGGPEGSFWEGLYFLRRAQLFAQPVETGQSCASDGRVVSAAEPGSRRCDQQRTESLEQAERSMRKGSFDLLALGPAKFNSGRDAEVDATAADLLSNLDSGQQYVNWVSRNCPRDRLPTVSAMFRRYGLGASCLPPA